MKRSVTSLQEWFSRLRRDPLGSWSSWMIMIGKVSWVLRRAKGKCLDTLWEAEAMRQRYCFLIGVILRGIVGCCAWIKIA